MTGDERRFERLTGQVLPAADDADRLDHGQAEAAQQPEQGVFAAGGQLGDLLDGEHAAGQAHEAHDVPGDAAWEGGEMAGRPLLQGHVPREVEQGGVRGRRGDLQGCRGARVDPRTEGAGVGRAHCGHPLGRRWGSATAVTHDGGNQGQNTVMNKTSRPSPVTVTQLPLTRCQVCGRTVAHRPGQAAQELTRHYERHHPDVLNPTDAADPADHPDI